MELCRVCGHHFNSGLLPASGPICIGCANQEGNLPPADRALLEGFKTRFPEQDVTSEPSEVLAQRLVSSLSLSIFGPVLLGIPFLGLGLLLYALGLGGANVVGAVGRVVVLIGSLGLFLRWVSVVGDALDALDYTSVLSRILAVTFLPYGLLLTLSLRSQLMKHPGTSVRYGRLTL
jgi:hypothetical protein